MQSNDALLKMKKKKPPEISGANSSWSGTEEDDSHLPVHVYTKSRNRFIALEALITQGLCNLHPALTPVCPRGTGQWGPSQEVAGLELPAGAWWEPARPFTRGFPA